MENAQARHAVFVNHKVIVMEAGLKLFNTIPAHPEYRPSRCRGDAHQRCSSLRSQRDHEGADEALSLAETISCYLHSKVDHAR